MKRQKAKERQKEHNNTVPGKNKEGNTWKFSTVKGRTLDTIAGFAGVSRPTLKKAEEIVEEAEQEPQKYQKKYGLIER